MNAPPTTSLSLSREAHTRLHALAAEHGMPPRKALRLLLVIRDLSGDTYHPQRGRGTVVVAFKDALRTPILPRIRASGWRLSAVAESVLLDENASDKLAYWKNLSAEDRGTLLRTIWPLAYVTGETPPELSDEDLLSAP